MIPLKTIENLLQRYHQYPTDGKQKDVAEKGPMDALLFRPHRHPHPFQLNVESVLEWAYNEFYDASPSTFFPKFRERLQFMGTHC